MSPLHHLERALAELDSRGLLRTPALYNRDGVLLLCTNDYLGYGREPLPVEGQQPSGSGASRLIAGDHPALGELEQALCAWLQTESALVFSSGYAANVGTLVALAEPGDVVVSDNRNHASIIDGCRLCGAEVVVTDHLDADGMAHALQAARAKGSARRWLVTESYFSMNGTTPELSRLRAICDEHEAALIVDEAHSIGVFGPSGRGLCAEAGVVPDVLVGTMGKSLGLQGAFVAGAPALRSWLWNRARTHMFSTAISPWLAAAARQRVERTSRDDEGRRRLHRLTARLRHELCQLGAPLDASHGPILFWRVGEPGTTTAMSAQLLERGIYVPAIRPPTVPPGESGLRITVSAQLSEDELALALEAFAAVLGSDPGAG